MEGTCGTLVVNNTIKNVYHGIAMAADDGIAQDNSISFFAGDGIRANGSRLTLRRNRSLTIWSWTTTTPTAFNPSILVDRDSRTRRWM